MVARRSLIALFAAAMVVAGCGSQEQAEVTLPPKAGDTVNGAEVVSSPPDKIPAGGVMLRPKDPNDPKYKPDPRLSGGG